MDGLGVQVFDSGDRYVGLFANNMVRAIRNQQLMLANRLIETQKWHLLLLQR
jgi:hypothetical protein